MTHKREIITEIGVFERLKENPDFAVFCEVLRSRRDTVQQTLRGMLTTKQEVTDHNVNVGIISGIDRCLNLVDEQIKKYRLEMEKREKESA